MTEPLSEAAGGTPRVEGDDPHRAIGSVPRWYHTLELEPGLVTPGWFDLRPVLDRLPWPDVAGKRCLDVGPYDEQLAFELERRGAAEVVATDIADTAGWDWPARLRASGPATLAQMAGPDPAAGFKLAKSLLGSRVERVEISVYELSPERVGRFEVVTCGSLLLHLRDPVLALEAIRGVCDGHLLSAEHISVALTLLQPRRPAARFRGGDRCQWWIPNVVAHRRLVEAGGFEIERTVRPYAIPLGSGHPVVAEARRRPLRERLVERVVTGGYGVPHSALLAQPDPDLGR